MVGIILAPVLAFRRRQPFQADLSSDPRRSVPSKTDDLLEGSSGGRGS
jgi:hypothetical protein